MRFTVEFIADATPKQIANFLSINDDNPLVRVYCVGGVVRLGGRTDGCRWAGYRRLANATAKPCPRCGNHVARPGFRSENRQARTA